jgi:hypothetical protein
MDIPSLLAALTSLYMDTISRENNSMLPMGGVIVGAVALIIGGYAASASPSEPTLGRAG